MNKATNKVFAQAEALWRPDAGAMRQAFERRRAGIDNEAARRGGVGSGGRIVAQADATSAEIEARGAKILACLLDAHKLVENVRSKTYSVNSFCAWYTARIDEEAADTRRNAPQIAGSSDAVDYYVDSVGGAVQRAKDRAQGLIRQHFGIQSELWFWHYLKKLGKLKAVPTWVWVAVAGWAVAGLAILNPELAASLRALFAHAP